MNNFITDKNAERPASKKQLWALYCLWYPAIILLRVKKHWQFA